MKILHISIGNPAQHTGGLNRYCAELMNEQKSAGHAVLLLYPGRTTLGGAVKICDEEDNNYSIQNALPVAITYGIDKPERYMKRCDTRIFARWLKLVQPDVIHVHSIQGIYAECFQAANELQIPMVFTTHDYYPICYRCTLVKNTGELCEGRTPSECAKCNIGAGLSNEKQYLLQSKFYQTIKRSKPINAIRRILVSKAMVEHSKNEEIEATAENIQKFTALGRYYDAIMDLFTIIHANSPRTSSVYERIRPNLDYCTIPITHSGLKRVPHDRMENKPIRYGYMGGMSLHKGYTLFNKALDLLDESGHTDWEAYYYGGEYAPAERERLDKRRNYDGYFTTAQEQEVWNNIDVLLVPCVCGETYGFVVLEALCHGVPVICSDLAGSKFLVEQVNPRLVFEHTSTEQLISAMMWLEDERNYCGTVKKIEEMELPTSMQRHTEKVIELYRECIQG